MTDSWDPQLYDGAHAFVHEYGEDVLELLAPQTGEQIIDLGCGTGHLAAAIADNGVDVTGIDADQEMIHEARNTYPQQTFIHATAQRLSAIETLPETVDAVFTNAALHWIPETDQQLVADSVFERLRAGGRFVGEFGGYRNVHAIESALKAELTARGHQFENPWYFPSIGTYSQLLEAAGFEIRYMRLFDRPTELEDGPKGLRNWLEMFTDSFFKYVEPAERDSLCSAVEARLRGQLYDTNSNTWTADYRRLRFVAVVPEHRP
ncbi:methyltransferase domain-containing protein [Natronocalculus amylovorans]|uniref:Class I SAM-dependent methyltransferase n=1 Tax=Natronocalculus amylovorans TaxID=2917812 RepID=A0AAE3FX78_9EURY|nr:methyltransferase domain-containing protein [Natronocalculus amylovorans]MCL9816855.1 class I SAM-dependent methyltransferase [Natronocalculus amylovorans]